MWNRVFEVGFITLIILTGLIASTYSLYTYEVSDEDGLDYVESDLRGLDNIVDRVDIERVSVEISNDYMEWKIEYKGAPLTNDDVLNAASNGSYTYRVWLDVGATVNNSDGHVVFDIISSMGYDETKGEYEVATSFWYVYDSNGNILEKGFGMYNISGNQIQFKGLFGADGLVGPPTQSNEYLNLTSYVNQQGKDLIIDTLSYKVEVDIEPRDFSENVTGGDSGDDTTGSPPSGGESSEVVETPEIPKAEENDDGIPILYIGVAFVLVISLALFLLFKRRN